MKGREPSMGLVWAAWVMILLCIANAGIPSSARAALPADLQQRKQDPEVERIITALETKAQAVRDGVWTWSASGGAYQWRVGFKDKAWYVLLTLPKETDVLLFSDGEWFYDVPRRQRFTLEMAEHPQHMDARLSYVPLLVNLRPRQFLGGAAGLRLLGEETIEGQKRLHLQADPSRDELAKAAPHVRPREVRPRTDYYYDRDRNGIVRIDLTIPGAVGVCQVTAWDAFGTAAQWPKNTTGQLQGKGPGILHQLTVASYSAAEDERMDEVRGRVSQIRLYSFVLTELRSPKLYEDALALDGQNHSDRLCYIEALLNAGQLDESLNQWLKLDKVLTAASDRPALGPVAHELTARAQGATPAQSAKAAEVMLKFVELLQADSGWAGPTIWRRAPQTWQVLERSSGSDAILASEEGQQKKRLLIDLCEEHGIGWPGALAASPKGKAAPKATATTSGKAPGPKAKAPAKAAPDAATLQRQADIQRLQDRLIYLTQRLETAKKQGRPQAEMDAIQQSIEKTQKDLAALIVADQ